jgi:hypothetical protein
MLEVVEIKAVHVRALGVRRRGNRRERGKHRVTIVNICQGKSTSKSGWEPGCKLFVAQSHKGSTRVRDGLAGNRQPSKRRAPSASTEINEGPRVSWQDTQIRPDQVLGCGSCGGTSSKTRSSIYGLHSVGLRPESPDFPGLKLKVEISKVGESRMQQRHNRRWDSGMIDSAPF